MRPPVEHGSVGLVFCGMRRCGRDPRPEHLPETDGDVEPEVSSDRLKARSTRRDANDRAYDASLVTGAAVETREVACPLCGADRPRRLFEASDRLHGTPGTYTYVRCEACGLTYMNPQVYGDLLPLYPYEYAPHQPPRERGRRGRVASLVRGLPGLGRLAREALSVTMVDDWVAAELSPESRWLDVGCGNGAFLRKVREDVGCTVCGVDVAPAAVEVARAGGLEVHLGTVEDAPYPAGHFDVISGWWFLEHVPNPNEAVAQMASLLKDGGRAILAVPNVSSLNARLFGTRWYHLDCPRHLTLWTPATMRRLCTEHGLAVDRIRYDKSAWGLRGSLRLPRGASPAVLPWTILMGFLRLSDTIVVYGQRRAEKRS
jgi:SAM-dependent methyltransferase